jgi:hypothetical protein
MFRPDDEEKPFIARWNMLVRILLIDSSVKHIARAAMDYSDFDDGSNCHPSNDRIGRETGYGDKAVRQAWAALRGMDMAVRVENGVSYLRRADVYQLQIPEDWYGLPVLGPHGQKFTCVGCQKVFNPAGNCLIYPDGKVKYDLRPMAFCSAPPIIRPGVKPPREPKPRKETCFDRWDDARHLAGEPSWRDKQMDDRRWPFFYQARGDDW